MLIADEPTTGLDITTQAVIMDLIAELAAAAQYGDPADHARSRARRRILRPHRGHACRANRRDGADAALFARPRHPYTAKLIAATPGEATRLDDLAAIPGALPDLRRADLPACRYSERCERQSEECLVPPLPRRAVGEGSLVACRHPL